MSTYNYSASAVQSATTVLTLSSGGTGYSVGDEIRFDSSTGNGKGFKVSVAGANSAVTSLKVIGGGECFDGSETLTQSSTTGSGSGCTVTLGALTPLGYGFFSDDLVEAVYTVYGVTIVNNGGANLGLNAIDSDLTNIKAIISYVTGNAFGVADGQMAIFMDNIWNYTYSVDAVWGYGDALTITVDETNDNLLAENIGSPGQAASGVQEAWFDAHEFLTDYVTLTVQTAYAVDVDPADALGIVFDLDGYVSEGGIRRVSQFKRGRVNRRPARVTQARIRR